MFLDLVPFKKIVMIWRSEGASWPKHHYSTVTIHLVRVKGGTKLTLTHYGVPRKDMSALNRDGDLLLETHEGRCDAVQVT